MDHAGDYLVSLQTNDNELYLLKQYIQCVVVGLESKLDFCDSNLIIIRENLLAISTLINSSQSNFSRTCLFDCKSVINKILNHIKHDELVDKTILIEILELLCMLDMSELVDISNNFVKQLQIDYDIQADRKYLKSELKIHHIYIIITLVKAIKLSNVQVEYLHSETFENFIIKLVLSCNIDITTIVLLSLVPKLIESTNDCSLVKRLWFYMIDGCLSTANDVMEYIKCHDGVCLPKKISVLCTLAHYYISRENEECLLVTDEAFWSIICSGTLHPNPLLRKEALYLAKRAVEFLEMNAVTFNVRFFMWDAKYITELKEIWKDVFIVLEVLEEKQVHLVTPVLPSVIKLSVSNKITGKVLLKDHWISCICQRILNHDSSSVVRWGLINLLCVDTIDWAKYDACLIKTILNALNNTALHSKSHLEGTPEIGRSLESWFTKITVLDNKNIFFDNLLALLCEVSWAPIPLFCIVRALASVPSTACWGNSSLEILKRFILETLGTHSIHIRGAIQCSIVRSLVKLTDTSTLDYKTLFDLISVLKSAECLRRGTETWSVLVEWLKSFVTRPTATEFVKKEIHILLQNSSKDASLSASAISRCLVLLFDAEILCISVSDNTLFIEMETALVCPDHASTKPMDSMLLMLINIKQEIETVNIPLPSSTDNTKAFFLSLIKKCLKRVMTYIEKRYRFYNGSDLAVEIDSLQLYLSAIFCFGEDVDLKSEIREIILNMIAFGYGVLNDESVCNPLKQYFSIMLVSWVAGFNCTKYKECKPLNSVPSGGIVTKKHEEFVERLLKENKLNKILVRDTFKSSIDNCSTKLASGYVQASWSLFNCYLIRFENSTDRVRNLIEPETLIDLGLEATQIGGREILCSVNKIFLHILPEILNELNHSIISRFITATWEACFELRKLDLFWRVFKSWIEMVYQRKIFENDKYRSLLLEYANKILEIGGSVSGLSNSLLAHLNEQIVDANLLSMLSKEFLIGALIFGPVHRKDLRVENEICSYIVSEGNKYSINILKPLTGSRDDCEVRLLALEMLLKVSDRGNDSADRAGVSVLVSIMESLMAEDDEISEQKKRYYGDSYHHRVKNRILQALLVLEQAVSRFSSNCIELLYEKLLGWLSDNLSRESHQPSVRYQLEWLLVRCLLHRPQFLPKFWIMFEKGSEERAGSVCSYIAAAYHLAAFLKKDEFSSRCVQEILPWCMAQHFNVGLYAQVALSKLWSINESSGWTEQHSVVRLCLAKSLSQSSAIKNAPKLQSDFYFSNFHPIKHFSLKTIFQELPRLSNVTTDEWCSETTLQKCFSSSLHIVPLIDPIRESDGIVPLSECQPASWTFRAKESVECNVGADVIQKKFVPWRSMFAEEETDSTEKKRTDGLIVVASLIDRPPNLGGLSRTCEVFGVSQLVLNSLHYLTDKQFTSLSMSSEKHVSITEVKEYHLTDYLQRMKRSGFTLIGAEQTAGSIQLSRFKFPVKTILLLGNEKEGVPANLLPLLDVCVEIPQYGLVRSLNVHVTGALFVWEYAKQHKQ